MYPNLELEMFKRKISAKDLAKELHISESAMYKKLRGEFDFKLSEARKLMLFFGNNCEYLFKCEHEQGKVG